MSGVQYGTAGFRANASLLDDVVQRCGTLMALLSAHRKKYVGIMITASHNPEEDNGVKLVDYTGEMIEGDWEVYANNIVNHEYEDLCFVSLLVMHNLHVSDLANARGVIIGVDTRQSGQHLKHLCASKIKELGGTVIDVGIVSTPELQFYVQQVNNYTALHPDYCSHISLALKELVDEVGYGKCNKLSGTIHIDCANGVGARKVHKLFSSLKKNFPALHINIFNTGKGRLNHECGADYVEKHQCFPCNMPDIDELDLCFSLDGDSDRVVCFTKKADQFVLLNGDKIATLFASYINSRFESESDIRCAVIQTAYANGASTNFIKKQLPRFSVECTSTGVKHLHEAAKRYDVGVYFEANGHGTVLINNPSIKCLDKVKQLLSQVTGDAIGNMLFILHILNAGMSVDEWISMYDDYPSKQTKLYVPRSKFRTANADTLCIEPHGLQIEMNRIVDGYECARAFVRPSGTEDGVRLYVEALHTHAVNVISAEIEEQVKLHTIA